MLWADILTGLGFMFIFEGVLPFINPHRLYKLLEIVGNMSSRQIRIVSLMSMIGGATLVYIARGLGQP